jgi:hypothetical protein
MKLTMQEFDAIYKAETKRFSFMPSRRDWYNRSKRFGINKEEFDAWAMNKIWWVNHLGSVD